MRAKFVQGITAGYQVSEIIRSCLDKDSTYLSAPLIILIHMADCLKNVLTQILQLAMSL